jgi:hypothetical protein
MNMKIARLSGLMMIAILAVSLVAASAAFAEPLFTPVSGQTVTATSGGAKLNANNGVNTVECAKSVTLGGKVESPTLVGGIVVHFLECTAKETGAKEECSAKSKGAPAGNLILTETLHGVLGLILPKLTGHTGVGLLLLPASGKTFVTLQTPCTSPATSAVSGNVVGEVEPVEHLQSTGLLLFGGSLAGAASVKDFDLSTGGLLKPKLEAYSEEADEQVVAEVTFGTPTEIM